MEYDGTSYKDDTFDVMNEHGIRIKFSGIEVDGNWKYDVKTVIEGWTKEELTDFASAMLSKWYRTLPEELRK